MAGNAINAKSEALELHELSSEELDAVSGGDLKDQAKQDQLDNLRNAQEFKKASEWLKAVQGLIF
jgi:hypothetical protein